MEGKTTKGSNGTVAEVNYVSQEELKEKLEAAGFGQHTLTCVIFNPTQNERTSRGDNQIKPGGSLGVDNAIERSTEKFDIDMLHATVKIVDKEKSKDAKKAKEAKEAKEKSTKEIDDK